jgi:hypothetical protein
MTSSIESDSHCRPDDFDVAKLAKVELQKTVDKFKKDYKPSSLQRFGFLAESKKTKANDLLESAIQGDFNDLTTSLDDLEAKWKENHGPVSLSVESFNHS